MNKQTLNVAVIGCGYWGPNLIRNFVSNDRANLVAVCDRDPQKLQKIGKRYPHLKLSSDISEILANPGIDAISVATPVQTHYSIALEGLLAGKHVIIEKPMALNTEQCEALIMVAKQKNLVLMVGHTFVYHGAVAKMKEVVDKGELGDILYFDSVRVNLGLFQSDINVICDLAPHDLSIMDYLIGKQPLSVHAIGATHAKNHQEDIAYLTLTFPDDVIAHLHVSWLSPVKVRRILLGGTKKMLMYDDLEPMEKIRVYDKGISVEQPQSEEDRYQALVKYRTGDMVAPVIDMTEALATEIDHFVDCALNGKTPITDGYAGLRVVQILEAAEQSLKTGQPVSLEAQKEVTV